MSQVQFPDPVVEGKTNSQKFSSRLYLSNHTLTHTKVKLIKLDLPAIKGSQNYMALFDITITLYVIRATVIYMLLSVNWDWL